MNKSIHCASVILEGGSTPVLLSGLIADINIVHLSLASKNPKRYTQDFWTSLSKSIHCASVILEGGSTLALLQKFYSLLSGLIADGHLVEFAYHLPTYL